MGKIQQSWGKQIGRQTTVILDADLIVEALGQLSVSAAIESVLGGRFNGNDSGTIESAGIESVVSGICECYRRIIRERTTSRRARMA